MRELSLRERTINAMRELVKRNGITSSDGYTYFAFDRYPPVTGYAYKNEVELAGGIWLIDDSKFVEGSIFHLGKSNDVDHTLLMTEDDIFGDENGYKAKND